MDVDVDVEAVTEAARQRRRKSGIPEGEGHRPKWMLAIEMLDGLAEHGLRWWAADSGYGDSGPFRAALDERGIAYSVQVKGETLAHPAGATPVTRTWSGRGRPPTRTRPDYPDDAISVARRSGRGRWSRSCGTPASDARS